MRLEIYKNSRSKRVDELERKMKDLEILENIDLNKILAELKNRDKRIDNLHEENRTTKGQYVEAVREKNSRVVQGLKDQLGQERELKLQAYDRLESLRVEMRALEGKDYKSDLWKEKCRELFDICTDLQNENDSLKGIVQDATTANLIRQFDDAQQPFQTIPRGANSVKSQTLGAMGMKSSHNTIGSLGNATAGSAGFYGGRLASGTGLNASRG